MITAQVSSSLSLQGPAMFQQPPSQQFPAQFNTQFGAGYVGQIRPPLGGHPFRPYRPFHERSVVPSYQQKLTTFKAPTIWRFSLSEI